MRAAYPGVTHLTDEYLRWTYVENPDGLAFGLNAYHEGRLIAHYATRPWFAEVCGARELGLISLNTATHPDYRGKGLMPALARRTLEAAGTQGFCFATGAANQNSTSMFIHKVGYRFVRKLDARLGVGPVPALPPGPAELRGVWTRERLRWRLLRPDRPYRSYRSRGRDHVCAPTGRFHIWVEIGDFEPGLVPEEIPRVSKLGNPVRLWIGSGRQWSHSAYVDIPPRLRPAPLNWLFLDLTGRGRLPAAEGTAILGVDFDAY